MCLLIDKVNTKDPCTYRRYWQTVNRISANTHKIFYIYRLLSRLYDCIKSLTFLKIVEAVAISLQLCHFMHIYGRRKYKVEGKMTSHMVRQVAEKRGICGPFQHPYQDL